MERGLRGLVLAIVLLALGAIAWAQGDATPGDNAATPGTAAPAAPPLNYNTVTSQRYGFSIALPTTGTLLTPESSNWPWRDLDEEVKLKAERPKTGPKAKTPPAAKGAKTPPAADADTEADAAAQAEPAKVLRSGVAFHWYGIGPVKEIIVHCHSFQTPVMEATFDEFIKAMKDDFTREDREKEEKRAKDKAAPVKQAVGIDRNVPSFSITPSTLPPMSDGSHWTGINVKDQRDPAHPVHYSILSTYGANKVYSVTLFYLNPIDDTVKQTGAAIVNTLRSPEMTGPFGVEPTVMEVVSPDGTLLQPGMRPDGASQPALKPAGA